MRMPPKLLAAPEGALRPDLLLKDPEIKAWAIETIADRRGIRSRLRRELMLFDLDREGWGEYLGQLPPHHKKRRNALGLGWTPMYLTGALPEKRYRHGMRATADRICRRWLRGGRQVTLASAEVAIAPSDVSVALAEKAEELAEIATQAAATLAPPLEREWNDFVDDHRIQIPSSKMLEGLAAAMRAIALRRAEETGEEFYRALVALTQDNDPLFWESLLDRVGLDFAGAHHRGEGLP